ncbi:uncharacterized protein DUF1826 [Palleronia aestuarii]|uniref:Uncharacterized protein DUF1826 n=1 Tax=Palleronia aestuarii TaxID=568105 RepID=A0A2W7PKV9_9RHOB|nr:DUF1826 domain-containing protein [Palleronia aestuarii]PZX09929.1 uncharacterized protein DUF1826 [Palleronia aestuarii]
MTIQSTIDPPAVGGVLTVQQPDRLWEIRSQDVGGVIWQRCPLTSFQAWIDGLDPECLPRARTVLRPDAVGEVVLGACDSAGTPDGPERRHLIDDIATLADIFSTVMGATYLRLRLDVVDTNACRRFHIDRLTARLICTYRGTATQYGTAREGDPGTIHTVPTGTPFLMRGTLWPARPDPGLVHRSPPIEGSGKTRLILVLDPVEDPSGEP